MQQENNLENFKNIYDFTKRNYNIIIHGLSGIGKFNFIISVIEYYYEKFEISKNNDIKLNPDIFYVSLPLYNSSGMISGMLNNDESSIVKNKDTWTFEKPVNSSSPIWILTQT